MTKLPYVPRPCNNCPFRRDTLAGWLGSERMLGILESGSFVCHKTTQGNPEDRRQCAGHMIMKGKENDFVRLAGRLKMPLNLSGHELVFESETDCIKHHE